MVLLNTGQSLPFERSATPLMALLVDGFTLRPDGVLKVFTNLVESATDIAAK